MGAERIAERCGRGPIFGVSVASTAMAEMAVADEGRAVCRPVDPTEQTMGRRPPEATIDRHPCIDGVGRFSMDPAARGRTSSFCPSAW